MAFNLSLHEVVGLVVLIPLTVITFTGIVFAFPNLVGWFQNLTPAEHGEDLTLWTPPETAISEVPAGSATALDADEFAVAFEQHFPERAVEAIIPPDPADPTATWQAWVTRGYSPWTREGGAGNVYVALDQYSGEVRYDGTPEAITAFGQAWSDWGYPLHTGAFGATAGRVTWTVVAVTPLVLGVTGVIMWLLRLRRRRRPAT